MLSFVQLTQEDWKFAIASLSLILVLKFSRIILNVNISERNTILLVSTTE